MTTDTIPDPLLGDVLDGRYRFERLIGRGGMGRVFRAEHIGLGRAVAIKVLDPAVGNDDDARRRFEREATITARLRHPNCVGVTDFGQLPDGSPYLVMDLVEGQTLDDLLADTPRLPVERAVHVMRHVLRGLGHAHAQGLVHRDLKPCNIMLVTEGADRDFARILDFGLARLTAAGDSDRITRTGIVCGTPRYMSPEQAQDRALDPRTDLYAASVIFFEMLAGRTPFHADEALRILTMHLKDPVPAIADVAPGVVVPRALEELVCRGLAKAPADRPATAEEYLAALDAALAPANPTIELSRVSIVAPGVAPAAGTAPAAPRRPIPRRYLAWGGGALAVLVVIGVVASLGSGDGTPPPATAAKPADDPEPEIDPVPSASPVAAEALRLARSGRGEAAVARLRELRRKDPDAAEVPYALGRVYTRLDWPRQAIDAFRDAIELDERYASEPGLILDLIGHLDSRSTWQVAARVLEHEVGAPAVPALTETAERHRDATVRERARRIRDRLTP